MFLEFVIIKVFSYFDKWDFIWMVGVRGGGKRVGKKKC